MRQVALDFDAIHASPPCQAFTVAGVIHGERSTTPTCSTPTRQLLETDGLPWVIENVPDAPMRIDLVLCGTAFPELRVKRHRWFEFSDPLIAPPLVHGCDHSRKTVPVVRARRPHLPRRRTTGRNQWGSTG